jgi:cellulase (glycosyl hydrolase family 5)
MSLLGRVLSGALVALALLPAAALAAAPGVSLISNGPGDAPLADQAIPGSNEKWAYLPVSWAQLRPQSGNAMSQPAEAKSKLNDLSAGVDAYTSRGFKVMLVLTTAPDWSHPGSVGQDFPPSDAHFTDYAEFAGDMAKLFKGRVSAWQIWNEPDEGQFWKGGPEPARFANLLKAAYPAIKAEDAAATVVGGGLVANNYEFVQKLYDNGAGNSFDAVATHMGTSCLTKEPGYYTRDIEGATKGRINRFSFTAYREVHRQMAANGQDKPIFLEMGWSTADGHKCNVGDTSRPAGVTDAQQASFLTQAYQCLATDPFVRAAGWFSLKDPWADYTGYDSRMGLTTFGGTPRPSFTAMQAVAGGVSPAFCGGKVDTDVPSVAINAPDVYYSKLRVRGTATDPTTRIRDMELWVDGKKIGGQQEGASFDLDWLGSQDLSYGDHRVELRAADEAFNEGVVVKTIKHVNPDTAPRTFLPRVSFKAKKKGKKISVTARVLGAASGDFTEKPRGGMRLTYEWKRGKKFVLMYRTQKGASKTIRHTFKTTRPGTWRVRPQLVLKGPYKNIKIKPVVFKIRG